MNHRPAIFKVNVSQNGSKKLQIGRHFQEYLEKECEDGEVLDVVVIHQRNYCEVVMEPKEYAKRGNWVCSCDAIHPHEVERCEECGDEHTKQGGREPYKKIRAKFGNMREEP